MKEQNKNQMPQGAEPEVRLDDESRIRVLSPWMLVFKRFIRNRLAVTGLIILAIMFVFSFLGGFLMPYTQSQVFYKYEAMDKEYASVIVNDELRYVAPEGETYPLGARAQFILALNNNKPTFTDKDIEYTWSKEGEDFYRITKRKMVGTALAVGHEYVYSTLSDAAMPPEMAQAFEAAQAAGKNSFDYEGITYSTAKAGKSIIIGTSSDAAIASMRLFDAYDQQDEAFVSGYDFRFATEMALVKGEATYTVHDTEYSLELEDESISVYRHQGGTKVPFAIGSELIASALAPDIHITVPLKDAIMNTIQEKASTFTFPDPDGTEVEYKIHQVYNTYRIMREAVTQLYDTYSHPSTAHWMGTDSNGMDLLTRLMYGGRISLMVGFVVVFIELIIGVIIGGVAGYFGGWIDTLLMRFIDLNNCIPYYPVLFIIGAVMDGLEVDPYARIFILMLVLGLLYWPSIARIVRGQILSLREQDFMVAAEATGIRVSRRIFRHLVPNVMPLLIVQGTMNLGSIIIIEATLSFLGLGLKFPMASWGTIINDATNIYVMTNYWFIWVPAGLLILLTVLGFNFVGDGLRDAFDPKMKR